MFVTTHWSTASRSRLWGEGKENKRFGGVNASRFCYTHAWKRDCPTIFSGLYMQLRALILLPSLLRAHYTCCWCHWYDSKTNVVQDAAGPFHGSLVWHNVPWLQKTYQMGKKTNTTNLLLSCNNNTPPTAGWGKNNLTKWKQRSQYVSL